MAKRKKKKSTWHPVITLSGFDIGVQGGVLNTETDDYTGFSLVYKHQRTNGDPSVIATDLTINMLPHIGGFLERSKDAIETGMKAEGFTVVTPEDVINGIEQYIRLHKELIRQMLYKPTL